MNTPSTPRKSPRAAVDQPGVMTVRSRDQRLPTRRVPVAIKSISCDGVGLALREQPVKLEQRSTIVLDFNFDGHHFELPGTIVWVASAADPKGPVDAGIRFQLAAVPNDTRQAYARWVVDLLRRRGVSTPPPRT